MANDNLQVFKYEARNAAGAFVDGKIKAESNKAVAAFLVAKGYLPLDIREQSGLQKDLSFGPKRVKQGVVANFMRQFATLNGAGIPISRGIDVLKDQAINPTFKQTLIAVRKDIETGSTLGNAMSKHPIVFTPLSVSMIKAGEAGGFLTETLGQVADNLEADVKLKSRIKSAMTYPVAVLILAGILVTAMLLFIVPIFADMFATLGGDLPIATQILVKASAFVKFGGVPTAVAISIFMVWWNKNKHREGIRRFIDPLKMKLPVFGKLNQKITIARFTRNFGSLLGAGLPVMQVLDIVGATSGSTVLEDALIDVKKGVSQGELIAPQLAKHSIFPRMLVEMLSVGEDAGEIPLMMEKIAVSYDDEVETITDSLAALMEPIMLMFLGGVVGAMVIAMYMPIFSIYDLIGK